MPTRRYPRPMQRNRSIPASTVVPVLTYPDVRAAVAFLETAFGFTESVRIGEDHRAHLAVGDGAVMVRDVRHDARPPHPGDHSHEVLVRVEDARAHCQRARAAGIEILTEPTDYPYGERQYHARDPFGHRWVFSETLADTRPEDWGGTTVG